MRALVPGRFLGAAIMILGLGVLGCGDQSEDGSTLSPPRELVLHDRWESVAPDSDPYPRSADEPCLVPGHHIEDGALEVDTDVCGHVTLRQESQSEVRAGDTLTVSLYHANLWHEEPAEALLAIRLGGEEVWSLTVAIPQSAAPITESWTALTDVAAGSEVLFHLSNHGSNSWFFYALTVTP